ncbi:MAG: O-acetylhomoserine aminocarboxypropyltransferase/cysteine synthase family protein [Clostridia bacterium]
MKINLNWKFDTLAVQAGYEPLAGEPRVLPIAQSTTYAYDDVDTVADLFDLKIPGHMYTRISNPTIEAYEAKATALQKGVASVALSSGQSATMLAILNICHAGQHIVSASTIYGGSHTLFTSTLKDLGISVSFVDPAASALEISQAFRTETRLLFAETLGNPSMNVLDFAKFSSVAKTMDVPLFIDNTFPTPYLCNPFEFGANIIIHSTTKYMDGHALAVGGLIIDGGNYNWNNGKYPELTEPNAAYHGLRFVETFGAAAFAAKARVTLLRDIGCQIAPMNAFLTHVGLETLSLRMDKHSKNALALAEFLEKHPQIAWVTYPGLKSSKDYPLAQKYLPKGCSGVFTFGVKGGLAAGKRLMNALQLAAIVVHVGDARSCVLHPASMTHRQLNKAQQIACGVTEDLIRVSVGIEDIEDIIADFAQALEKSKV